MAAFANNTRAVFWLAVIPAAIAVLLVLVGVEHAKALPGGPNARVPVRMADLRLLPRVFLAPRHHWCGIHPRKV